ncbi:MAG: ATPase central domain protein [Clostridiales bacterium]|nr:ATPase central domain protein [Clostridiales bacterium]
MDLFSYNRQQKMKENAPLAERIRPTTLEDFIGQEHLVGKNKLLRRAIEVDRIGSAIFYGPPGSGKTTLAKIIAARTEANFVQLNAVTAGVKDLREVIKEAEERLGMYNEKTILFIDEIHRFNKAQQDALLPALEQGTITLIGATTENPYFEVNSPLLSRSRIFQLEPLTNEQVKEILKRALKDEEKGLGSYKCSVAEEALDHLVIAAGGDSRTALNALEVAVTTTLPDDDGVRNITLEVAQDSIQKKAIRYDKTGDNHYDVISAFIKSIRGSDPDAAIHWLARMLEAGEDPRFIARRMIVHAAEDIGLADPQALVIANAAFQAVEYVGLPEARIPLAQATIYLARAPKSNSVIKAIDSALQDVRTKDTGSVPPHLCDSHYKGAKNLNKGTDYLYPHDYPGSYVKQQYMPDPLIGIVYYRPNDNEKKYKK